MIAKELKLGEYGEKSGPKIANKMYAIKRKNPIDDLSFELMDGEILGISGESGSGKTTLLYSIFNLKLQFLSPIFFNDFWIFS